MRLALLVASLSGFWISYPLWISTRSFPTLPLFDWLPEISHAWDKVWFIIELLLLVCACLHEKRKTATVLFGVSTVLLTFFDQNRIQPWLYIYLVLLALLNWGRTFEARLFFSSIYFWSGIQKFNFNFLHYFLPGFFLKGIDLSSIPSWVLIGVSAGIASTEIAIAFLLWSPRWRWIALGLLSLIHSAMFIRISPLVESMDRVVWPWGFAMVLLGFLLFQGWVPKKKKLHPVFVGFLLIPALSVANLWDSYLSFAFYSGNVMSAEIEFSDRFAAALPASARRFTTRLQSDRLRLVADAWAMEEFGSPIYPEPRVYRQLLKRVCNYGVHDAKLISTGFSCLDS